MTIAGRSITWVIRTAFAYRKKFAAQLYAPRELEGSLPHVTLMFSIPSSNLYQYNLGYLADK